MGEKGRKKRGGRGELCSCKFSLKNPAIASFRLKIRNFRYHSNGGSVEENLTDVVKLADVENALLYVRIRVVFST